MSYRWNICTSLWKGTLFITIAAGNLTASTPVTWVGNGTGIGTYSDANEWNPVGVPTAGDEAQFTANLSNEINVNVTSPNNQIDGFRFNDNSSFSFIIEPSVDFQFVGTQITPPQGIINTGSGTQFFYLGTTAGAATLELLNNTVIQTGTGAVHITVEHGSTLNFAGNSSAGGALILADFPSGTINFSGSSTSDTATLQLTSVNSSLNYSGSSTAANAFIVSQNGAQINFNPGTGANAPNIALSTSSILNVAGTISSGDILIDDSTLNLNSGGSLGSSILTITNGSIVNLNVATTVGAISDGLGTNTTDQIVLSGQMEVGSSHISSTYSGVIKNKTGHVGSILLDGGFLTLTNNNTYTGGTEISSGELAITNPNAGGTGTYTIDNNAILILKTASGTTLSNNFVLSGSAVIFPQGVDWTLSGNISGAGTLVKDGSGTLTITNSNTFSLGTEITDGVIDITNTAALGTGTYSIGGGTLELTGVGASGIYPNPIRLLGAATFDIDAGIKGTFTGPISQSGNGSLIKTGSGTLVITNGGYYTGGTQFDAGTLAISKASALGIGTYSFNGGTLELLAVSGTILGNEIVLNGPGTINVASGGSWATGNHISNGNTAGTLIKTGLGSLQIFVPVSYTGGTEINQGTLIISDPSQLGPSSGTYTFGGGTYTSGGTLALTFESGVSIPNNIVLNGAGTISVDSGHNWTLGGNITNGTNAGSLIKTGAGELIINKSNSFSGGTQINQGKIAIDNASALGTGAYTFGGGTYPGGTLELGNDIGLNLNNNVVLNGLGVIETDSNVTVVMGGTFSGSGVLSKTGLGYLELTNSSNNYTGGTQINAGTLDVTLHQFGSGTITFAGGTYGGSGGGTLEFSVNSGYPVYNNIIMNGSGVIYPDSGISIDLFGKITDGTHAGLLTIGNSQGAGAITLSSTYNNYTGGTQIIGAAVNINDPREIGTGAITFTNTSSTVPSLNLTTGSGLTLANNIFIFEKGVVQTFPGVSWTASGLISDGANPGLLVKAGAGTLFLTNTGNVYTNGTALDGGLLSVDATGVLSTGTIFLNTGMLELTGLSGTLTNPIQVGSASILPDPGTTWTLSGKISDTTFPGPLVIGTPAGAGTIILTNSTNNYTLGTEVIAGTLAINNPGAVSTGAITLSNDAVLEILASSGSQTLTNNIVLNGKGTIQTDSSVSWTASGKFSNGTNIGTLVKDGPGILKLSNTNNSYTGGTEINAGVLAITNPAAISSGEIDIHNATLELTTNNVQTLPNTIGLFGLGTIEVDSGIVWIASGTFQNVTGHTGALAKTGSGTLFVTDSHNSNSYTGGTQINAGTLAIELPNALGTGDYTFGGGTYTSGGTLELVNGTYTVTNNVVLNGAGTIKSDLGADWTFSGKFSNGTNPGVLIKTGGGTLKLTGVSSTYSGGTQINAGTLAINNHLALGTGTYTFGGGTYTSGGILELTTGGPVTVTNPIVINGSGTIQADAGTSWLFSGLISNGELLGQLKKTGTGFITLNNTNTFTNGLDIQAGAVGLVTPQSAGPGIVNMVNGTALYVGSSAGTYSFPNLVQINGNSTINVFTSGAVWDFNGTISDGTYSAGTIVKTGPGTLGLYGNNTYTGGITLTTGTIIGTTQGIKGNISNSGTLIFDQSFLGTYVGNISGGGSVTIDAPGPVAFVGTNIYAGGTTLASGAELRGSVLSLQGPFTLNNASVLTFNQGGGAFTGTITGPGGGTPSIVNFSSNGTFSFTNSQGSFLGNTNVNSGGLALNTLVGGNVNVNGGTLSGTGTVGGNLTVSAGTIKPGNSIGTLTVLGNYVQSGGIYLVQINGAGQSSLIDVGGTATLSGGVVNVVSLDGSFSTTTPYTILHSTGALSGAFSGVSSTGLFSMPSLNYDYVNNNVFLSFVKNLFVTKAVTPNQIAVANQLDSITNPTADQSLIITALDNLTEPQFLNALDQMAGTEYASLFQINQWATTRFMRTLYNSIRGELSPSYCKDRCSSCNVCGMNLWGAFDYGNYHYDGNENAAGLRGHNLDVTLGAYKPLCAFDLGVALDYEEDHVNFDLGGIAKLRTLQGAVYADYQSRYLYILADVLVGNTWSKLTRKLEFGTIDRQALSHPQVFHSEVYGEIGANMQLDCASIQPFVGIEYGYYQYRKVTESGADSLDLQIAKSYNHPLDGFLGAHLGTTITGVTITADLAWQYRFSKLSQRTNNRFTTFGSEFSVLGVNQIRSGFVGAINMMTQITDCLEIYGDAYMERRGPWSAYAFSGGLNISW